MKKISTEKKEIAKKLLLAGYYGYQVSEMTGVSEGTINKFRKELKMEGHPVGYDR